MPRRKSTPQAVLRHNCTEAGCPATFSRRADVRRHVATAHSVGGGAKFECRHCRKKFKTASYVSVHESSCGMTACDTVGLWRCGVCDGEFANELSLRSHSAACGVGQKHACELCEAQFKRMHDLKRHVQLTHLKVKQLRCPHCLKSFGRTNHLRRHVAAVHGGKGKKMCPTKQRRPAKDDSRANYDGDENVDVDVDDEEEESPRVKCPRRGCGSRLKSAKELKRHTAECHPSPEQMIACPFDKICLKTFSRRRNLFVHCRTTHGHLFSSRRHLLRCTTGEVNVDAWISEDEEAGEREEEVDDEEEADDEAVREEESSDKEETTVKDEAMEVPKDEDLPDSCGEGG